jgi:hypothetical protein
MYRITITRDVLDNETINGHYWLAYHALNSLYGIPEGEIDQAFASADKGLEYTTEFNGKTFTIKRVDTSQSQMQKDLQFIISLLTPEISTAEDEDRQVVKLELGFMTNMQKILTRIMKNI